MKKMILAKLKTLKIALDRMSKIFKMIQIESSFKTKTNNIKTLIKILKEYLKDLPHY